MSDRTAAEVFRYAFETCGLIEDPAKQTAQARHLWAAGGRFDFSWNQMECDDVLIRLGLAHKGVDPRYPEDGVITIYHKFGKEL